MGVSDLLTSCSGGPEHLQGCLSNILPQSGICVFVNYWRGRNTSGKESLELIFLSWIEINKTREMLQPEKSLSNNKKKSFQGLGPRLGPGPELDNLSCSEYWKLGVPRAPGKFIENCGSLGQDWLLCLLNIPFFSIWDEKVSNIRKLNKTREMMRKHSKSGSNIHWLWGFMWHYSSKENIFRRNLFVFDKSEQLMIYRG